MRVALASVAAFFVLVVVLATAGALLGPIEVTFILALSAAVGAFVARSTRRASS